MVSLFRGYVMKKKLTIFTPAFNRAYTLHLCYDSLLAQSNKDFVWLIVDDGSSDNTRELVNEWKKCDNGFEIKYVYKENGGMHTAHNTAYEHIDTELNTCIDSDDYLADNAVEKIINFWDKYGNDKVAGIIGLDADFDGNVIGEQFPDGLKETTLGGYYCNGGKGDKKLVYRTEIINKYPPYPEFEGEKYVSLGYKYLLCDQEYNLLVMNEVLCNVEYREDGSSMNMYSQYIKNPKGFAFFRKTSMVSYPSLKRSFIEAIHYVAESILGKNYKFVKESPRKLLTLCAIPQGMILYLIIRSRSNSLYKV